MAIDECNERETWITTITFEDQDGDPAIPTTAVYRIDDIGSQTVIRSNTEIAALAASKEVTWTEDDTQIVDSSNSYELRIMTVFWTFSTDKHGSKVYYLNIKNLYKVTSTSPA